MVIVDMKSSIMLWRFQMLTLLQWWFPMLAVEQRSVLMLTLWQRQAQILLLLFLLFGQSMVLWSKYKMVQRLQDSSVDVDRVLEVALVAAL